MTDDTRIACIRQDILAIVTRAMRAWFEGDEINAGAVHAAIDRILREALAEERTRTGGAS
jgi:hypothetical protein